MKFMKRAGIYQASNYNVTFNPKTLEAFSYRWWRFVAVVEGKLIFDNYRYSNSTSKHQSKVRSILSNLNIKIDMEMPLPRGIRHDQTLAELIVEAEEQLCEQILQEEIKKQERYARAKHRKQAKKLTDYLENEVCFRDYEIKDASQFGKINTVAVHQLVDSKSMEYDVNNAIHGFQRDGFGSIVFYV